jgi:hypothetical protein
MLRVQCWVLRVEWAPELTPGAPFNIQHSPSNT